MNKKFLKHYMETNPEGTAQTYIFLVDNQDIALNIVISGYQALCLVQEDDGYYFSVDSFIEEMRAISSAVDGNENAIEKLLLFYEAYISKCCLRPFYDEYGNVYIVGDIELKGRIREALLKMICEFEIDEH